MGNMIASAMGSNAPNDSDDVIPPAKLPDPTPATPAQSAWSHLVGMTVSEAQRAANPSNRTVRVVVICRENCEFVYDPPADGKTNRINVAIKLDKAAVTDDNYDERIIQRIVSVD